MTRQIDTIYIAASAADARLTRICVASIRSLYPTMRLKLLAGGALEPRLVKELANYWDVATADIPCGDWGWGFVKLEPLFGCPGERFLVLDSDTVFVGPVLETWAACQGAFLVDDEQQTDADTKRLYYDWRSVAEIDPYASPPKFLFNSGQWFGTAGVLTREDFAEFIDWSGMPPKLRHPSLFMPGDQGVLNYVLNQKSALAGLSVDRRKIMLWPGYGMKSVNATTVEDCSAPSLIVHWAGYKAPRLVDLPGSDLLRFFERKYYERLPYGRYRRGAAGIRYPVQFALRDMSLRIKMRLRQR